MVWSVGPAPRTIRKLGDKVTTTPPPSGGSGTSGGSSGSSSSATSSTRTSTARSTTVGYGWRTLAIVLGIIAVLLLAGFIFTSCRNGPIIESAGANAQVTVTVTPETAGAPVSTAEAAPPVATTAPTTAPATTAPTTAADCIDRNLPGYALDVTLRREATDHEGVAEDLAALRAADAKYVTVDYSGAFAPNSDDVVAWMKTAACNGFRTRVGLDEVFKNLSLADAKAYIGRIDAQANQAGYLLSASPYAIPGDLTPEARLQVLHDRIAVVGEVSHLSVAVMTDFIKTDPISAGVTATKAYGGDQQVPVYLPWKDSSYGPVSDYNLVGQIGAQTGGAAVQAFDNGTGLPSPSDVKSFAQMLHGNGTKNVLVYTEGPAAADMGYLSQVSQGVAEVLAS